MRCKELDKMRRESNTHDSGSGAGNPADLPLETEQFRGHLMKGV